MKDLRILAIKSLKDFTFSQLFLLFILAYLSCWRVFPKGYVTHYNILSTYLLH